MNLNAHLDALRAKHATLETAIDKENSRPHPNDAVIRDLKRQKLKIKEELEHHAGQC